MNPLGAMVCPCLPHPVKGIGGGSNEAVTYKDVSIIKGDGGVGMEKKKKKKKPGGKVLVIGQDEQESE